jgi:hypothetical protein
MAYGHETLAVYFWFPCYLWKHIKLFRMRKSLMCFDVFPCETV